MISLEEMIKTWIEHNTIIRLTIVVPSQGHKEIVGRVLQHVQDEKNPYLLFFHDDEKNVYNIKLNEIEHIQEFGTKVSLDLKASQRLAKLALASRPVPAKAAAEAFKTVPIAESAASPKSGTKKQLQALINMLDDHAAESLLPLVRLLAKTSSKKKA